MPKFLLLIILTILSFKSFSQKDTTRITLSNQTAKLVIKDILAGDGCKEELEQTYLRIAKMEERDVQKDSVIHFLKEKDLNNRNIIGYKDGQIGQLKELSKNLEDAIEDQNDKIKWWRRGAIAGGVTTLLLLIIAF
jgi:hypothetical protein